MSSVFYSLAEGNTEGKKCWLKVGHFNSKIKSHTAQTHIHTLSRAHNWKDFFVARNVFLKVLQTSVASQNSDPAPLLGAVDFT